MHAQGLTLI